MHVSAQNIFSGSAGGGADWTASATVLVSFVALLIPFVMNWLQRRASDKEAARIKKERAHEATSATFDAIDVLMKAVIAARNGDEHAFGAAAAEAEGYVGVTNALIAQPGLTDGAIFSCVMAGYSMRQIKAADAAAQGGDWKKVYQLVDQALVLGRMANKRGQEVRKNLSIPERGKKYTKLPEEKFSFRRIEES